MNIPPARPVFSDADRAAILSRIDESLRTGALTLGANTTDFEAAFLHAHGGTHAIAVSSGTAALEIVFRAIGIAGRDVIVPTNTFYATAGAVVHAGGYPVLADVDPQTMSLSVASVEAALTENTAAVVVVHIAGAVTPATPGLAELCTTRGLALIEDAAHAHGASLHGQAAGTFGVAGTFSFYPTKVVTSAEGGMIVTADERIRDEAVIYRDQGKAGFLGGDHVLLGYAWRLSEPNAAIGASQVRRLGEFVARRRAVAAVYDEALGTMAGIEPLRLPSAVISNYYKYVGFLDPASTATI